MLVIMDSKEELDKILEALEGLDAIFGLTLNKPKTAIISREP